MDTSEETQESGHLHIHTPLVRSLFMEKKSGLGRVMLKLENLQPCGSFKLRGLARLCEEEKKRGATTIVCATGGNAGLAVAYAAQQLGLKAHIVVPYATIPKVRSLIIEYGAELEVSGIGFNQADQRAMDICQEKGYTYIHPFDNPTIWDGHATMIKEIQDQLRGERPSCIVTCVGGGGLLYGVLRGLDAIGWSRVPVLAMETPGSASFHASVKAGRLVTLDHIHTVATCLGALSVIPGLIEELQTHTIISELVPDRQVINACLQFADDHRMLVEPACGAALAAIYSGVVSKLQKEGLLTANGPIVVIVCGGASIDLDSLMLWREEYNLSTSG